MEGESKSPHYPLGAFDVRVKIVAPSMIQSEFVDRPFETSEAHALAKYGSAAGKPLAP